MGAQATSNEIRRGMLSAAAGLVIGLATLSTPAHAGLSNVTFPGAGCQPVYGNQQSDVQHSPTAGIRNISSGLRLVSCPLEGFRPFSDGGMMKVTLRYGKGTCHLLRTSTISGSIQHIDSVSTTAGLATALLQVPHSTSATWTVYCALSAGGSVLSIVGKEWY